MRAVDLHTHSTCSDGTNTPAELVNLAREKGLAAFALTDHDTAAGIPEAMAAARGTEIEVIPGIELSTKYHDRDVHIVGLYYDYDDPAFQEEVKRFSDARDFRNRKMCEMMCEAGLPIPYDELMADNPGAVVTRANMGRFLMKKGAVSSVNEAFEKYIGDNGPFFLPREKITPEMAVSFLLRFDGIPILAHPFEYNLGEDGLEQLVKDLKTVGLMGIEAWYCRHTTEMTRQITALAARYDLLLSGGSDYHGANKPQLEMGTGYGHLFVPEECLTRIKHAKFHVNDETKIFFCDFDGTLANQERNISPKTRTSLDAFVKRGRTAGSAARPAALNPSYAENVPSFARTSAAARSSAGSMPPAAGMSLATAIPPSAENISSVGAACGCAGCGMTTPGEPSDGNIFVLSSGRAMSDVKNVAKRLDLHYPNMYLSAWNGGELYSCDTGTTFFREYLPYDVVRGVMQMSEENGLYCQTYDRDELVIPEWGKEADYYTTFVKMPVRTDETVRTNPAAALSAEPCKCLVIHLENQEDHALEAFAKLIGARYGDSVRTVLSNPWYLEVDPIRATKAATLKWLCRHLGIDITRSIAAGDAPNDNPMIEAAGFGIGMCNGLPTNPGLRDIADIITPADNNHDGLAGILDCL